MFVASKSSFGHTHIDMQSLHGGGPHHHLIESALGDGLIQFALDRHTEEVFWSDSVFKKISWTDYTGTKCDVIYVFLYRYIVRSCRINMTQNFHKYLLIPVSFFDCSKSNNRTIFFTKLVHPFCVRCTASVIDYKFMHGNSFTCTSSMDTLCPYTQIP